MLKETTKRNSAFLSNQNLFNSFTSAGNIWITQVKACPKETRKIETVNSILILLRFKRHDNFPCLCASITIQANNTQMKSFIQYSLQLLICEKKKEYSRRSAFFSRKQQPWRQHHVPFYSFYCINQSSVLQQSSAIHVAL